MNREVQFRNRKTGRVVVDGKAVKGSTEIDCKRNGGDRERRFYQKYERTLVRFGSKAIRT